MEVRQIIFVRLQVQGTGGIVEEFHGLFAAIADFRMGADDVLLLIGDVEQLDFQQGDRILQGDFRRDDVPVSTDLMGCIHEFGVVVAVGVFHMQGRFAEVTAAGSGICHRPASIIFRETGHETFESFRVGDPVTIMERLQDAVLPNGQDQGGMLRLHRDDGFSGRCCRCCQGDGQ